MSVCSWCGAGNPGDNKFCQSCGKLLASSAPSAPAMEKTVPASQENGCPSCGASARPGTKFCLSCGAPLSAPAPAEQSADSVTPPPAVSSTAAAAAVFEAPAPAIAPPTPEPQSAVAVQAELPPSAPPAEIKIEAPPLSPPAEAAPVPTIAAAVAEASKPSSGAVCATCGTGLKPAQKFCLSCGTPVGPTTTSVPALSVPAAGAFQRAGGAYDQQVPFQKPARSGAGTLVIVIVLLAVMGGAGWYVWKYFSRPDVTVTLVPQKIHVAVGGKTMLLAGISGSKDSDVTWSIQEGDKGGQVVALGIQMEGNQPRSGATYTAPSASGTYHVIATSHANPSRQATAEIIVGSAGIPQAPAATAAPAPPSAVAANPNALPILGMWRWPSGEKMAIGSDSTVVVTSDTDPSKNMRGTYHFADDSHLQVDFGNGDVRTWQILGVDGSYLRVLSQSKAENSPTAIIFARMAG